jgi:hypothetical protein
MAEVEPRFIWRENESTQTSHLTNRGGPSRYNVFAEEGPMAVFSNRSARLSLSGYGWLARPFARLLAYLNLFADGFSEGRDMAYAAKKRHPFVEW